MKVAFYSYPSAFQNPGGGEVQLLKTMEYLAAAGVEVKLFDQWKDRLEDYDILHVFGSVKDCLGLMRTAKNKGVKIALSTIFWSSFKRAVYEGRTPAGKTELFIRHLAKLMAPVLPSGRRRTMMLSDILLPNSEMEAAQLVRLFKVSRDKIKVVPNGIDERFLTATPDEFTGKYGVSDFVLAVGRIEPRKNQLNLIKALKGMGRKLVIIGEAVSDYAWYCDECRKAAENDVRFLGGMKHESGLLASAYAACKVFAVPGWFETPGLAALEAAAAGAGIAVTRYGSTIEYFREDAAYFDPSNIKDIRAAVQAASEISAERKTRLKKRIMEQYLWQNVAEETLRGYKLAIEGRS